LWPFLHSRRRSLVNEQLQPKQWVRAVELFDPRESFDHYAAARTDGSQVCKLLSVKENNGRSDLTVITPPDSSHSPAFHRRNQCAIDHRAKVPRLHFRDKYIAVGTLILVIAASCSTQASARWRSLGQRPGVPGTLAVLLVVTKDRESIKEGSRNLFRNIVIRRLEEQEHGAGPYERVGKPAVEPWTGLRSVIDADDIPLNHVLHAGYSDA